MKFTERFNEILKQTKLTQKEIAKKLNMSEGNITNWKKGTNYPSIEILYELCKLLDESADYLLGLDEESGTKTAYNTYNNNGIHNGTVNFK